MAPKQPEAPQQELYRTVCRCWAMDVVIVVSKIEGAKCWGCGRPLRKVKELT